MLAPVPCAPRITRKLVRGSAWEGNPKTFIRRPARPFTVEIKSSRKPPLPTEGSMPASARRTGGTAQVPTTATRAGVPPRTCDGSGRAAPAPSQTRQGSPRLQARGRYPLVPQHWFRSVSGIGSIGKSGHGARGAERPGRTASRRTAGSR